MIASHERRYESLDGLRGVAALTVVVYHALLVVPAISALYVDHTNPAPLSVAWWLYDTPLRLLFAGHEAVLVFFVLSGFVLVLPFLHRPPTGRSVLAYYGRRIVRLYVPVWAAVAFALILALAVHRDPTLGGWLGTHRPPTGSNIWHDLVLVFGTSNLNSPLWSLTWEVWFSLLMPLMFLAIRVLRVDRWWWAAIPALMLLSALSRFDGVRRALPAAWLSADLLQYLPIFAIGMLLAFNRDRIAAAADRIRTWWPIITGALLLTVSPTIVAPNGPYSLPQAGGYLLSLVGVTIVVAAAFASPARRALETRPVQWAGHRSFSIYLVHEPILVAAAILAGANSWWWLLLAAALVPVILVTAAGFYRLVELPSITLSRSVGRRLLGARKSPSSVPESKPEGDLRDDRALT